MIIRESDYLNDTKWFEEGIFPVLEDNDAVTSLSEDTNLLPISNISHLSESGDNIFSLEYSKLKSLCEKYDLEYEDAINMICESNDISQDSMILNIKDYELIENPNLLEDVEMDYVLSDISDCSFEYMLAEQCLLDYLDGDEDAFDLMLEDADTFLEYILGEEAHPRKWREHRKIAKSVNIANDRGEDISVPNADRKDVQKLVNTVKNNMQNRAERTLERAKENAKKEAKKTTKSLGTMNHWGNDPTVSVNTIVARAVNKASGIKNAITNSPRVKKAEAKLERTKKAVSNNLDTNVTQRDKKYHDPSSMKYKEAMKSYNSIVDRTAKQNVDVMGLVNGRMKKGEHGADVEGRTSSKSGFMPANRSGKIKRLVGKAKRMTASQFADHQKDKNSKYLPIVSPRGFTMKDAEPRGFTMKDPEPKYNPIAISNRSVGNPSNNTNRGSGDVGGGTGSFSSSGSNGKSTGGTGSTSKNNSVNSANGNKSNLTKYGKYGLAAAGVAGVLFAANKFAKQAKNKPRTWIAKKIAALRSVYHKFMVQAQRNPQKSGAIKRIAAKILAVIDKLMAKLQTATN